MLVDYEGGKDLVPVTLWNAHEISLLDMAKNINQKIVNAKNAKDQAHNDATALFDVLPTYILGPLTVIASYIS